MGKYDQISSAKVAKTGQYFKPGKYKVRVQAVKDVNSQQNGNKNYTVVECVVVESNNPEVPVGAERSQVIDMTNVMGFPNLKAFMAAVSGVDPTLESVNDLVEKFWQDQDPNKKYRTFGDIVEQLVVKLNILEGTLMDLECIEITKRDGEPFTKHNWGVRKIEEEQAQAS